MLTLETLHHLTEEYLKDGMAPDTLVLITTSDPSVGGRAHVMADALFIGFDWEAGQLRIEPHEELVRKKG